MDAVIDSIGRNFERILRWVYPGALFLFLLGLGKPETFSTLAGILPPWGTLVVGFVGGFAAYLVQASVVNQVPSLFYYLIQWDAGGTLVGQRRPVPRLVPAWIVQLFDRQATATEQRWNGATPGGVRNYMNYAWATYHATSLTGWLTFLFYLCKEKNSGLAEIHWVVAWAFGPGLLLISWLLIYPHLSRVRF